MSKNIKTIKYVVRADMRNSGIIYLAKNTIGERSWIRDYDQATKYKSLPAAISDKEIYGLLDLSFVETAETGTESEKQQDGAGAISASKLTKFVISGKLPGQKRVYFQETKRGRIKWTRNPKKAKEYDDRHIAIDDNNLYGFFYSAVDSRYPPYLISEF